VGTIDRFASPEKLVAYIGLDSRVKESGTSVSGKGYMTRRKNPELKTYFEKKIGEGKHYFAAMCAVERKLVHLVYAVWKRGTPFEFKTQTLPQVKQTAAA
jgi:transposase